MAGNVQGSDTTMFNSITSACLTVNFKNTFCTFANLLNEDERNGTFKKL